MSAPSFNPKPDPDRNQGITARIFKMSLLFFVFALSLSTCGKQPQEKELSLRDFAPKSMLVTSQTTIDKARFPVIDAHNHMYPDRDDADWIISVMDSVGIKKIVNLCTQVDTRPSYEQFEGKRPDRFITFCMLDFAKYFAGRAGMDTVLITSPEWPQQFCRRLEEDVRMGVDGLKLHCEFGLNYADYNNKLVAVDDSRLDPIWAKCGELGIPIGVHVTDPDAFFVPIDRFNERWIELFHHPHWHRLLPGRPGKAEILEQRNRVMDRHPDVTFIGFHMGNHPEDLGDLARTLDRCPNFYLEFSARLAEIGRQPYASRKFFIKYQDRIMFGTDHMPPSAEMYRNYFRFLETDDEYFDYFGSPGQGMWKIYGIFLPDEVLKKVYNGNAQRLIPGAKI